MVRPSDEVQAYHSLAARMQDLMGHFGWDTYCQELEKVEQDLISRMLSGEKDQFEYLKGRIEGLREAVHTPALIVKRAKEMPLHG
jgi:hypothetical protein